MAERKAGRQRLFLHKRGGRPEGITHRQRTHFSVAVVLAILGFLLVAQITAVGDTRERLRSQSPAELGQIIRNLEADKDSLRHEINIKSADIRRYARDSQGREDSVKSAIGTQETLKVASAATAVEGPGISIFITDPESILSADDLFGLTEQLRSAGAEALSINGIRVSAVTGIGSYMRDGKRALTVSGQPVFHPYKISAIGDEDIMTQALMMPGGFRDSVAALPGINLTIASAERLVLIPAKELTFRYSKTLNESRD